MRSTILIGLTFSMLTFGTWAANLVCYQPQAQDIDPLAPITVTIAF